MNEMYDYDTYMAASPKHETLDFQRARRLDAAQRRYFKQQRILGAFLIALGTVGILCTLEGGFLIVIILGLCLICSKSPWLVNRFWFDHYRR